MDEVEAVQGRCEIKEWASGIWKQECTVVDVIL